MADTELIRSGTICYEKFLGDELAAAIIPEIMAGEIKDGQSDASRIVNRPGTAAFLALGPIWDAVRTVFPEHMIPEAKQCFSGNTYLQHLLNSPDDNDEQKVFHSDTFFPCVKFWYFPHSVSEEQGAFWYVKGSPILTAPLIDWHADRVRDLKAGTAEGWRGPGHSEGSFRISPQELRDLGYSAEPVCVEADTLVIANTHGFHRRGDTSQPTHRLSIHGSIRISNPFAAG